MNLLRADNVFNPVLKLHEDFSGARLVEEPSRAAVAPLNVDLVVFLRVVAEVRAFIETEVLKHGWVVGEVFPELADHLFRVERGVVGG